MERLCNTLDAFTRTPERSSQKWKSPITPKTNPPGTAFSCGASGWRNYSTKSTGRTNGTRRMWSKKMTSRFEIRIFLYGRLAYVYQFDDYAEARKTYLRETGHFEQYTQLVVEGEIYNTAKAERFFGPRSTREKWELLAPFSSMTVPCKGREGKH